MPIKEQRPKNVVAYFHYVIYAREYNNCPVGTVMTMISKHSLEDHIRIHKLEGQIVPCDGRPLDPNVFPELYKLMQDVLPPGSEVRVPLMDASADFGDQTKVV